MDNNENSEIVNQDDTKMNINNNTFNNNINRNNLESNNYLQNLNTNNNINPEENSKNKSQRKLFVDLQDGTEMKQPEEFCDNSVRTNQYTIITFLPLALFNQYKNPFNIFFLVTMVIALIPQISPLEPATTIMPVVVVMIINLIREIVEDYRKYSNDKIVNEYQNYVYKLPKFLKQKCESIKVGNIVRVKKNETIPADLLIIKTSLKNGFCYMQTANLDGETSLKPREALNITQQKLKYESPKTFKNLLGSQNENCYIEVDVPNDNIYEIGGSINFKNQKVFFDSKNILLKGARLKSVSYAFGITIYTGKDTKLMKNINRTKLKKSDIDKILLYIIIFLIGLSILMTIISTVIGAYYRKKGLPDYETNDFNEIYIYYYRKGESKKNSLEIIRLCAAHFQLLTVIPISIMIVNAVIKVFQSEFLEDSPQYREDPGDKIKCYSTDLIEQLGKIKFIFSDKTGTLTKNEMIFKGCSIYTKLFDNTISNTGKIKQTKKSFMPPPTCIGTELSITQNVPKPKNNKNKSEKATSYAGTTTFNTGFTMESEMNINSKIDANFCTDYFYECLNDIKTQIKLPIVNGENQPFLTQHDIMEQFLLNIVTNHDVLIEKRTKKNDIIYQGISPDEVTLVSMADEIGYSFLSRENEKIIIEIYDSVKHEKKLREYQILQKFDFSPERQCSSIIVKDIQTNKIFIYIKGSDRKITQIIDSFSKKYILEKTMEHVDQFAHQGLRTLCYSFKIIEEQEYNTWLKEYEEMKYLVTKDKSLKPELDKVIDKIELNSILLGATALEDKLQDRVKRDIEDFIEADINFWMITGDKMDTAETIGHSCGIISEDSEVFKIREKNNEEQILEEIENIKNEISKADEELEKIISHHNKKLEKIKNIEENKNNNIINVINNTKESQNNLQTNQPKLKEESLTIQNDNQTKANNILNNENNIENNLNINNILNQNINPNINQNNINNADKKSNYSNTTSENSVNISEVIDYLMDFEDKKNDEYLEELSVFKKNQNQELIQKSQILKNYNNTNNDSSTKLNLKELEKIKNNNINSLNQRKSNRKEYIKAYDFFQNKLNEFSKKTKNRCFLFKLKYIYPQPEQIYAKDKKVTSKYTIIIEGSAIDKCIESEKISGLFYELIKDSRSLICCRASPSQKSKIVNFIKKKSDQLTLAIGDGGNDVNMIKAAHVGIGIFGKEGYQAAYNSDYAISQFKYLKRLLFVDGRFSLARNSYFIYHYFFKNVIYSMTNFWFQIFSQFSGRTLMDDWYATCYNSFFTVVPVSVRAVVEEDFDADFTNYSKKDQKKLPYLFPDIYKEFRESRPFNIIKFIFIYMLAFFIAILFFIIPAFSFYKGTYGMRGITYSFWDLSWVSLFSIILTHFAMVFQDTFLYIKFNIFWYSLQITVDVIVLIVLNQVNTETGIDDALWFIMGNLNFWFTLVLIFGLIFIPFFILRNAEYFFGGFIVNLILLNRIDNIYLIKYCQKKVDEMTRINRRIVKFMKLYKNPAEAEKVDNYADKQMKEIVRQFRSVRKEKKYNNKKIQKQPVNLNKAKI